MYVALISTAPLTYLALSTVQGLLVDSTANKANLIQKRYSCLEKAF